MIKIYFDNTLIDENYYSALTNDYKLFTDNFYLGSTASNTFKLSVAKTAVSSHPTEVKITDDTNTYYLIVDKIYEEKNFYVYDLVDKLVLFNFNYNAKTLIDARVAEELTTTLSDILADMCTQAGVILDSTLTLINDIEVDWYDNTLLARDYLSYIAELQGGYARILDDGKLTIVGHKMASQSTIQIDNCEDFILGEKKTISRVVYDDGINKYEYGDETANTLYINQNNVYITDTTVVSNIYDEVVGLEFYLVETGKCRLDPSVRAGDIITFTDGTNSYLTIANYSSSFGGGYWLGNYSLNVANKQQEETQVKGVNTELKSIKTIIDRTNASLSIVASSVSTLEGEVENIELQRPFYRYSANADGSSMTTSPQVTTRYLGTYVGTVASSTYTDYTWTLIKGADGQDGADGVDGSDGVGITSAVVTYQLHTNGTTAPTGSWLSSPPTPEQGKYLWVRTITTYSDSSSSTTYAVSYYATDGQTGSAGSDGADGTGIFSTEVKYQIGTSGTVAPTGTWLDNVPTAEQGKYLWTRTIITYTDTSTSTAYSTSYYATDGERGSVIWTTTTAPTTPNYTFTISNLVGGDVPRTGDIILYSYYKYTVVTVSATTLLAGTRVSIRGATGATGTGAKWYTGTAITGTSTTATVFSGSGITAAVVGDMYLNTSTNNTYRCTLAGNAATAKWVFEVNIKGLDGSNGDDGKSLWLAYCDEVVNFTGFTTSSTGSSKDYYGMFVGLVQSNTATDYEWYISNYKLNDTLTTLRSEFNITDGKVTTNVSKLDKLENYIKTTNTTANYLTLLETPKSRGAIKSLSIKGFVLSDLYPSLAYPSESTYPTRLSFYTLVFDKSAAFNSTPEYVTINSPIPLQKIGSVYDEISIIDNVVYIIQRIGYTGTTAVVLGTPITHKVGGVMLPTLRNNTYIKVLNVSSSLIYSSTYMQYNALTNEFATQVESKSLLEMTDNLITTKVSSKDIISEINQSPEEISINASKISLQGYTTINNGFSVDLDGNATMNNATINGSTLKLADDTVIVGGNGILTNLQYKSSGAEPLGYRQISLEGIGLFFGYIGIQGFIPNNFTMREAYITVTVFKTRNEFFKPETLDTTSIYGKVTNIRLYKVASTTEYINSTNFGLFGFDLPTGTEVTNAFATGGYTNATTDGITFTSIDISDKLQEGTNDFFIATGDTLPDGGTNAGTTTAAQKSQIAIATLTIIGFSK